MVVFDCCLVVNLSDDNFSEIGSLLLTGEYQIAIENACVYHGITLDAEGENIVYDVLETNPD